MTHRENWCPDDAKLAESFEKKFFGAPKKKDGKSAGTTDYEKGKSYWPQIEETYREVGFEPEHVQRVWVCWIVKGKPDEKRLTVKHDSVHRSCSFDIEILSLRNLILPELNKTIGTSNYDDVILRTLGFVKQLECRSA